MKPQDVNWSELIGKNVRVTYDGKVMLVETPPEKFCVISLDGDGGYFLCADDPSITFVEVIELPLVLGPQPEGTGWGRLKHGVILKIIARHEDWLWCVNEKNYRSTWVESELTPIPASGGWKR